jgi:hypothetical protein
VKCQYTLLTVNKYGLTVFTKCLYSVNTVTRHWDREAEELNQCLLRYSKCLSWKESITSRVSVGLCSIINHPRSNFANCVLWLDDPDFGLFETSISRA